MLKLLLKSRSFTALISFTGLLLELSADHFILLSLLVGFAVPFFSHEALLSFGLLLKGLEFFSCLADGLFLLP